MIFFHIGLHKTGTTFLQKAVFPKWKDIEYIVWPNLEIFLRLDPKKTYLVSREGLSGQNWAPHEVRDRSMKKLSELFPGAKIIISFRNHVGYINSSYRQYLQRGGTLVFEKYFDIIGDNGLMKKGDFLYKRKIESICTHFNQMPFIFLHEEIKDDLQGLLYEMQKFIGGQPPLTKDIKRTYFNKSVGYYPAQVLRKLNAYTQSELNPKGKLKLNQGVLEKLRLNPRSVCQKWLSFFPDKSFISKQQADAIQQYYKHDWEYIKSCAKNRDRFVSKEVIDFCSDLKA